MAVNVLTGNFLQSNGCVQTQIKRRKKRSLSSRIVTNLTERSIFVKLIILQLVKQFPEFYEI